MTIDFENTELTELTPKIAVVGVGGAGCNAVNNMIAADLQGVDFIVANTDAQALANSSAGNRIQLGVQITQGLGAGAQPKIGAAAAEEAIENIDQMLEGVHMVFVTCGMGGGTGTGAAPVIAKRARERGILTVGVVTKPFHFEGGRRMKVADSGIGDLAGNVDTLIVIPNQNLFRVANEKTTFADAFSIADEVLHSGVRGITDLMVMPGLINLDFADVRTVMSEMGKAMMGTGEAIGESRAVDAAAAAISNPLLEEASLRGAKGVIINVTGGMDMTLYEVDEAVNMVRDQVDPDALIVFGSAFNDGAEGSLRVSVVATGIDVKAALDPIPGPERTDAAESGSTEQSDADMSADPEEATAVEPNQEVVAEKAEADSGLISMDDLESAMNSYEEKVVEGIEAADSEMDAERKAVKAQGSDLFVAEAAKAPKASIPQYGQANVFQEAAYENVVSEEVAPQAQPEPAPEVEAAAPEPKKKSLFQLMTAGLRGNSQEPAAVEEVVAKRPVSNDAGVKNTKLGGVTSEDRIAPTAKVENKEQLEIPSFLRRQSN